MKRFTSLLFVAALLVASAGCSSSGQRVAQIQPAPGADEAKQSQEARASRENYSAEDWFYDYYDVSEDEESIEIR